MVDVERLDDLVHAQALAKVCRALDHRDELVARHEAARDLALDGGLFFPGKRWRHLRHNKTTFVMNQLVCKRATAWPAAETCRKNDYGSAAPAR